MCKAITKKGTQCSRQAVVDGYCGQHADEIKAKYQFLMEDDYNALIQRIGRKPEDISDEDKLILKNFGLKTQLTSIPIEYNRNFCHPSKYYAKLVQTSDIVTAYNTIKCELCDINSVRRTIDEIEYYRCMLELAKVFIIIIAKLTNYHNKTTKILQSRAMIEALEKAIEKKEKEYAEEQLNILRTKEVGSQEILSNDVFKHIFTGYL